MSHFQFRSIHRTSSPECSPMLKVDFICTLTKPALILKLKSFTAIFGSIEEEPSNETRTEAKMKCPDLYSKFQSNFHIVFELYFLNLIIFSVEYCEFYQRIVLKRKSDEEAGTALPQKIIKLEEEGRVPLSYLIFI